MGCVYRATCSTNGKQYIGMTTNSFDRRKYEHSVTNDGTIFHKAIKKYTKEDFEWDILFVSDDEDALFKKERLYIKVLGTLYPLGYNMASGGRGSPDKYLSSKAKRRLKANGMKMAREIYCVELNKTFPSMKELERSLHIGHDTVMASMNDFLRPVKRFHFCRSNITEVAQLTKLYISGNLKYGFPVNMAGIMKGAEKTRGRTLSAEHKAKASKALMGRKMPPRTKETYEKWKETVQKNGSIKTGAESPAARKVINLTTNIVYGSITDARDKLSLPRHALGNIVLACKNPKRTAYGYRWAYYNEGEDLQRS